MRGVEEIPPAVLRASREDWGVLVDAYLTDAAQVGKRFAATLFFDQAGVICNGETVVTPPLRRLDKRGSFWLMQSECGQDHYVVVSNYRSLNN
nr:hypothetical protein [Pseudomonas sp. URMO17WK12:I2]